MLSIIIMQHYHNDYDNAAINLIIELQLNY